jgi:APA family basic amino acid/polyamine antiporter
MEVRKIDFWSATSMVIANMIGTGVFTSLGFQLGDLHQGFSLIMVWFLGGLIALTGAICYAEVANRLPKDGGEFYFLSEMFHPALGVMAGFVSTTVGFAAPVAGASLALGAYVEGVWPDVSGKLVATIVVVGITFIHAFSLKFGLLFQRISTLSKVLIILAFVIVGLYLPSKSDITFLPNAAAMNEVWQGNWFVPAFSISLVWVSFAYSGWNASAYIAGSITNPQKNLSRSIILGTISVTVMYLLLNMVFLKSAPISELVGKKEVGLVAARSLFGDKMGAIMGGIISVLLISTISSMIFTGPRVLKTMFEKMNLWPRLYTLSKHETPAGAIYFQGVLSLVLLFTMNFESLIYYVAFTLSTFTLLTVIGMMKMRLKLGKPTGYSAWGYPITPIIFIIMTASVAWYFINNKPFESALGLATSLFGLVIWWIITKRKTT